MSSPLPPDPYVALGVDKEATATQVKSVYRKLVLKCHPDKVTDPAQKSRAADEFHRIQQAYEILSDEDRRSRYDAQVKLAELRRDVMEKQRAAGPRVSSTTTAAAYQVPTAGKGRSTTTTKVPDRIYEERRPTKTYDSDHEYFPDSRTTKKHDDYEKASKKSVARDDSGRSRAYVRTSKETEKASRSDRRRTRDKETRRDRESKFPHVVDDSESDEVARRARYEAGRRRDDDRRREEERERELHRTKELQRAREREAQREREVLRDREAQREREMVRDREAQREREAPRERERERERDRDPKAYDDYTRKYSNTLDEARNHIGRTTRDPGRPAALRTTSLRDGYNVDRPRDGPPVVVRRSSARPRASARDPSPPPRRDRDQRKYSIPEVVELPRDSERERERERRPPTLQTSTSSPAAFKSTSRAAPVRTQSLQPEYDHVIPPPIHRSETVPNFSPRRKDASVPMKSSHLRETEINEGLPTPSTTPEYVTPPPGPPYSTTRSYRYAPNELEDAEYTNGRRTVLREPVEQRRITRSPSPVAHTRPSNTRYTSAPQPPPLRTSQPYYAASPTESPTSYTRNSPTRPAPPRRESTKPPLYGELPKSTSTKYDYSERESPRARYSPDSESVSYAKKYTQDDVRMASGYSTRKGGAPSRPNVERSAATYAY